MASDLTGTTAEFDYSYSPVLSGQNLTYGPILSAFSLNNLSTVTVTISASSTFTTAATINAGFYGDVIDSTTTAQGASTNFDIGFSSSPTASSIYTTSTTATARGAGPSNVFEGDGTLELGGVFLTTPADNVTFKGTGNTLILDGTSLASTISGFNQSGDEIVLTGIADNNAVITSYSSGVLKFTNNGTTYTLNLAGLTAGNFKITNAATVDGGTAQSYKGDLVIDFVPCFLAGTMIATPTGETAVEALRAGDLVTVLEADGPVSRPLVWSSGSTMRVHAQREPDAAFPVRIVRHAFARNVPHRDLLVTPEHCILTEAGLVPARMLVNGASILIDRTLTRYEFFHLELERHGILLSEGLSTESYLDSGNRALFHDGTAGLVPRAGLQTAAPLAVTRAAVEPIWNRLADRARGLGLASAQRVVPLTDQPDLRLLLDDGRELTACWHNRQRHMFHVPRGTRPMRLMSRAAVPAESVGPFVDDRRRLGIAVERLVLWTGLQERVLPAGAMAMSGWHGEEGELRWTDGNAALDLPCAGSETFLDIHVAGTMLYPADLRLAA